MSENNFTETNTTSESSEAIYFLKEIMRLNEKINELEKNEILHTCARELSTKICLLHAKNGDQNGFLQELINYNNFFMDLFNSVEAFNFDKTERIRNGIN